MGSYPEAAQPLADLEPVRELFDGIDSDGCAFDNMEIKHKECFIPAIMKHWQLQPVSKYGREAYMARLPDPELDTALARTTGVNEEVADFEELLPEVPLWRC